MKRALALVLVVATTALALDIPGGQTETSASLAPNTYQLVLGPSFSLEEGGAYFYGKLRYQAWGPVGLGLTFGTGQAGFQFGMEGTLHLIPEFALRIGGHFERANSLNYFVGEATPIASTSFRNRLGTFTPYAGIRLSPSFRIGVADNALAVKTALGNDWGFAGKDGLQLWTELGLAVANCEDEVVVGLSYPFTVL